MPDVTHRFFMAVLLPPSAEEQRRGQRRWRSIDPGWGQESPSRSDAEVVQTRPMRPSSRIGARRRALRGGRDNSDADDSQPFARQNS
jgi:hypothetical protein